MRAVLAFSDGTTFNDADHTFDVKDIPVVNLPVITTTTTAGATPQSGVELLDLVGGGTRRVVAVTDLNGNVIWTYDPGNANETPNPIVSCCPMDIS